MQVLAVALQGRVLTPAQLSAGWYLLPADAQLAAALAQQGAAWLHSVAQPVLQDSEPPGESRSCCQPGPEQVGTCWWQNSSKLGS